MVRVDDSPDKALSGRVPRECPQEAADLYLRCLSHAPGERPSAPEVVDLIARLPRSGGRGGATQRPAAAAPKPA